MPNVPPKTMADIPRSMGKKKKELEHVLFERACSGYTFSFNALLAALMKADSPSRDEALKILKSCIVAFTEEEAKGVKAKINEDVAELFTDLELTDDDGKCSFLHVDPWGVAKDYILMQGTATSFSKDKAAEILAAKLNIDPALIKSAFDDATTQSKYWTAQARTHKGDKEK